jgi:hypothetical protein
LLSRRAVSPPVFGKRSGPSRGWHLALVCRCRIRPGCRRTTHDRGYGPPIALEPRRRLGWCAQCGCRGGALNSAWQTEIRSFAIEFDCATTRSPLTELTVRSRSPWNTIVRTALRFRRPGRAPPTRRGAPPSTTGMYRVTFSVRCSGHACRNGTVAIAEWARGISPEPLTERPPWNRLPHVSIDLGIVRGPGSQNA